MSRAIPCAVEVVEPSRTDSVVFVRRRYGIWRAYDAEHLDFLLARGDLDHAREEIAVEAWLPSCPEIPDASTHAPGAERGSDSLLRQAAAMDTRAGHKALAWLAAAVLAVVAFVVAGARL